MAFKKTIFAGHPQLVDTLFAWNRDAEGSDQTIIVQNGMVPKGYSGSAPAHLLETEAGIAALLNAMLEDGVDWDQAIAICDVAMTSMSTDMGADAQATAARYVLILHEQLQKRIT